MTGRESGYASIFVLGMVVVVMAVVGLAIDGTRAFLLRRSLQNSADAAALAGANELDVDSYYRSGGGRLRIDPLRARATATRWLAARGISQHASVVADGGNVSVAVTRRLETTFLRLIGMRVVTVGAEARAEPVGGRP